MSIATLVLIPDSTNFSATLGQTVVVNQLKGGLPRFRQDLLNQVTTAPVQWTVNGGDFEYLQAFYRKATANGSQSFLVDLIVDHALPVTYTCMFVEKSWLPVASQAGNGYVVKAQLYVVLNAPDDTADQSIIDVVTAFGNSEKGSYGIDLLTFLINVKLPEDMP